MSVRIRLSRRGRKSLSIYDIVVADSVFPRDGRFIEKLGSYNPNRSPSRVLINSDRAVYWLGVGAVPTQTVRNMLSREGILLKRHLIVGVKKGAITELAADKLLSSWQEARSSGNKKSKKVSPKIEKNNPENNLKPSK